MKPEIFDKECIREKYYNLIALQFQIRLVSLFFLLEFHHEISLYRFTVQLFSRCNDSRKVPSSSGRNLQNECLTFTRTVFTRFHTRWTYFVSAHVIWMRILVHTWKQLPRIFRYILISCSHQSRKFVSLVKYSVSLSLSILLSIKHVCSIFGILTLS